MLARVSRVFVLIVKAMYRTLLATCGSTDFEYFFILILGESFPRSHTLQATCGTLHFTPFELRKQIAVALRARPLGLFLFFAIFRFRFFLGCLSELLFLFLLFLLLFLPERAGQFLHIRHGVLFVHDFCA